LPGQLIGQAVGDFFHPGDRDRALARFREIAGDPAAQERSAVYRLRTADGSYRHLDALTSNRLHDPGIRGIFMMARDVTDRVLAEQERAATLERRRLAARVARIGIWEWDPATDEMLADESVREIARSHPGQMWRGPAEFLTRFLPEDGAALQRALRATADGDDETDLVVRMPLPDGSLRWLYIHAQLMPREAGPPHRVLGLIMDISQRKQAEEQAAQRRELLDVAAWGAGLGVWTWDVAADQDYVDDKCASLMGLARGAGCYTTPEWESVIHPEDLPAVRAVDRDVLSGKLPLFECAYRVRRRPDSWHWVFDRGQPIERAPDGRALRVVGVTLDFDETKRREQELADQRLRLDLALSAARLGLWDLDVDTRRLQVDDRYTEVVGLSAEAVRDDPRRFNERLHPDERDRTLALTRACLDGRSDSVHYEGRMLLDNGRLGWVAVDGFVAERHADGRPARLIGTVGDVTERRRREQLWEIGERIAQIGSWEFDVGDDRFYWSEGTYRIFELSRDFVPVPGSTRGLLSPASQARLEEAFAMARGTGRAFDLELDGRTDQGRPIWVRILGRADVYAGRPVRIYGIVQDVTERRMLESALLEVSNREQQRFGAELHDGLGQELTGISLMLQGLAQQTDPARPSLSDQLARISLLMTRAIGSARALAHGLAPVSTSRAGLEAALRLLAERSAQAYGAQVSFELLGTGVLTLDEHAGNHLYRVAQEAVSNAVRHGSASHVGISLAVHPGSITLTIADDGCGIQPGVPSSDGLGLRSMAYRARSLDGTLDVSSRPGGGTVIRLDCPQPGS
jgi:PAS domain S-box-containing protein